MSKNLLEQMNENGALAVTSTIEDMLKQKTRAAIEEARKQVAAETFGVSFEPIEEGRQVRPTYSSDAIAATNKAWKATDKARNSQSEDDHRAAAKAHKRAAITHVPGSKAKEHHEQAEIHNWLAGFSKKHGSEWTKKQPQGMTEDSKLQEEIEAAYEGKGQLDEAKEPDHAMAKDLADKALYNHNQFHAGNHDEHHGGWAMHDLHTWAKNYAKKHDKGTYDKEKAVKGLTHAVKNSEPSYFGRGHMDRKAPNGKISGATRTQAARHLLPHVEKLMAQHTKKKINEAEPEHHAKAKPAGQEKERPMVTRKPHPQQAAFNKEYKAAHDAKDMGKIKQLHKMAWTHDFDLPWRQTGSSSKSPIHSFAEEELTFTEAELEEGRKLEEGIMGSMFNKVKSAFKKQKPMSFADHMHQINHELQTKKNNSAHASRLSGKADQLLAKKGLNPNKPKATALHAKADSLLAKKGLRPAMAEQTILESASDYKELHKAALAAGYSHVPSPANASKASKGPDYHHYTHPNGHTMSVSVSRGVHGLYGKPKGKFMFLHAEKDMDAKGGSPQSGETVHDFNRIHGKAEGK